LAGSGTVAGASDLTVADRAALRVHVTDRERVGAAVVEAR
jgi:hypothetical protein